MTIRVVLDRNELVEFFSTDRTTHLYALADLDEPYWSASRWWRRGDAVVGRVVLEGSDPVLYAVSTKAPTETLELVVDLGDEVPPGLVTGPIGIGRALAACGRTLVWNRRYHRFALETGLDITGIPKAVADDDLQALFPSDAEELLDLYSLEPGAAFFLPSMLGLETFVGVRHRGQLVAAAGTHVCSEVERVAAIGAVFTHPDHRGRGLGARVTAAVVKGLEGRVDSLGLNCTDENVSARRVYQRLGFRQGLAYEECELAPASGVIPTLPGASSLG